MPGQRLVTAAVVVLGALLGALIAGIPDISHEMTVSADNAGVRASTTTPPTRAPERPASPSTTAAVTTDTTPARPPEEVRLLVVNGAGVDGAAGATSDTLEDLGYDTLAPSNTEQQDESVVYFREGYEPDARAVAGAVDSSVTVAPMPDPVPFSDADDAHLVVVLGRSLEDVLEASGDGDGGGGDSGGDSGDADGDSGGSDRDDGGSEPPAEPDGEPADGGDGDVALAAPVASFG